MRIIKMKGIFSLVLATIFIISSSLTAFASTGETSNAYKSTDTSQVSISDKVSGLDSYMSLAENGTIIFNSTEALSDGYSNEAVSAVKSNISSMNALVVSGKVYIDASFNAHELPLTRAGVSKVVTTWYGLTQIYMTSSEANQLIKNLSKIGDATTIAGAIGFIPGASIIGSMATVMGIGTLFYRWQVEQAAASGRGIIMNIYTYNGNQSIWFTSQ